MRFLLLSGALLATASCAWPPPPSAAVAAPTPPPPVALTAPAPPPPVALTAPAPTPPPAVAAVPAPAPFVFAPFAWLFGPPPPVAAPVVFAPLAWLFGPPTGRLTLSNFAFDSVHVEAVVTGYPDCAVHEGTMTSDFVLPLNGTRVIEAGPGSDVCWRRAIAGEPTSSAPGWTEWNRAFLSSGRSVDSQL